MLLRGPRPSPRDELVLHTTHGPSLLLQHCKRRSGLCKEVASLGSDGKGGKQQGLRHVPPLQQHKSTCNLQR